MVETVVHFIYTNFTISEHRISSTISQITTFPLFSTIPFHFTRPLLLQLLHNFIPSHNATFRTTHKAVQFSPCSFCSYHKKEKDFLLSGYVTWEEGRFVRIVGRLKVQDWLCSLPKTFDSLLPRRETTFLLV